MSPQSISKYGAAVPAQSVSKYGAATPVDQSPPEPNARLVGAPPVPHMLSRDVPTPSTGTETEARQKYFDAYHQDAGPGYMHNTQGNDELAGASLAGIGAPAIAAGVTGGLGAGISAIGTSVRKAAVDALTGAAASWGVHKGASALGAPEWLSDAAGMAAGMYGWSKADLIQNFMKESMAKGEVPSLARFVKWTSDRSGGLKIPPLGEPPNRFPVWGWDTAPADIPPVATPSNPFERGVRPMPSAPSTRTPVWQGMPEAPPAVQGPIDPISPPEGYTRHTPPPAATPQRTPLWQGMPPAAPASQSPIEPIVPPVGATRNPYAPKSETVPVMERPDMKPMNAAEAHRYAHAQATEAELPGSPAGTSKGAHDWLSTQAKVKYGVKSWHELTPAQMQGIGDDLLDANRAKAAIPPVK